jgi:peroxiredoxin
MEPLLLQATTDPDIEVRQLAFTALARLKHPQVRQLALAQLSDADPAVRLMGLQSLRSVATSNEVPLTVRFLEDPDPRVVVAAIMVLQRATAQNFGIKSSDALPQFTCIDTNPPPAPDLPAILKGVQQCQQWWSSHKGQYQSSVASLPQTQNMRLPAADFGLEDSVGNEVRLCQFLGKNVLLVFWSPGAPASLDDVSALKSLQEKQRDRLAVLGICLPAAPNCADEHADAAGLGTKPVQHHSHESSAPPQTATQLGALVKQAADRLKINFPMLVDPRFTVGGRFDAEDLPLYVLIDSHGTIRRRFVGFRSERALSAMVAETDSPSQMMR